MAAKCSNCVWCITSDYGYSNYTVEGTDVYCGKKLNPEMPFDRWYGEDKRDLFAESCDSFIEGDGVDLDVDRDEFVRSDNPEIAWAAYLNGFVTGAMVEEIF